MEIRGAKYPVDHGRARSFVHKGQQVTREVHVDDVDVLRPVPVRTFRAREQGDVAPFGERRACRQPYENAPTADVHGRTSELILENLAAYLPNHGVIVPFWSRILRTGLS